MMVSKRIHDSKQPSTSALSVKRYSISTPAQLPVAFNHRLFIACSSPIRLFARWPETYYVSFTALYMLIFYCSIGSRWSKGLCNCPEHCGSPVADGGLIPGDHAPRPEAREPAAGPGGQRQAGGLRVGHPARGVGGGVLPGPLYVYIRDGLFANENPLDLAHLGLSQWH